MGPYHPLVANGSTLAPGENLSCGFSGRGPAMEQFTHFHSEIPKPIGARELDLYVVGWADYIDDLGISRRFAFCREYIADVFRFFPVDDPDHEYAD
jgi:hypothetical protein